MNCPICKAELNEVNCEAGTIMVCPENHGIFLAVEIFDELSSCSYRLWFIKEGFLENTDLVEMPQNAVCPDCEGTLIKVSLTPKDKAAIVHSCIVCQHKWIDMHTLNLLLPSGIFAMIKNIFSRGR